MGEHHGERLSEEVVEMLAERFKVFSEPMRLKHLGMLLDAAAVGRGKQGLHTYYKVTDRSVYILCDLMWGPIQDHFTAS